MIAFRYFLWCVNCAARPVSAQVLFDRQAAGMGVDIRRTAAALDALNVAAVTACLQPQSFKARQVPANIYESRYSAMVEARLAAHR